MTSEKFDKTQIKQIHTRGKLPVIVGGTNYYIESLLWDFILPLNAAISLVSFVAINAVIKIILLTAIIEKLI